MATADRDDADAVADLRSELRRNWAMLDATSVGDGGVLNYEVAQTHNGPILVNVGPPGVRHLLVPGVYDGERIDGVSLSVGTQRLTFDGVEKDFLDVNCRQANLFDTFDELVVLIVEAAAPGDDPVFAASAVIEGWRDLLRTGRSRPLSHEQELGMIAELWTLRELSTTTALDANCWRGPLREPKDVVFADAWVEVKGVGVGAAFVRINGLDQLADVPNSRGCLVVVVVESDSEGFSVDDLAAQITLNNGQDDLLEERLRVAGWTEANSTGRRWAVTEFFVVEATRCPRIVPESFAEPVPAAVRFVRYQLDLAVARSVSERDATAALRGLVGVS